MAKDHFLTGINELKKYCFMQQHFGGSGGITSNGRQKRTTQWMNEYNLDYDAHRTIIRLNLREQTSTIWITMLI